MTVPVWKRKLSSAEYVYQVYRLNIRLGEILNNKPKKYKGNYSDHIIKAALSALEQVQLADSIYLSKYTTEQDYEMRHDALIRAKGEIQHIATACFIFLEIVRKHDHASESDNKQRTKIYDQELEIGEMCETCYKLICGVIDHDKELYKKHIKPKTV